MLLPKFIQSLFMAALLSTEVIAGDKQVPRPHELGLYIPKDDKDGWKEVTTPDGFFAKVFAAKNPNFIEVSLLENPTGALRSYEALLSIWEYQTGLTVRSLEEIMYDCVVGPDMDIINKALELLGYNPSGTDVIFGSEISKDSSEHSEVWDLLSTASFATDAVELFTEFQDMRNRYIESFKIGRFYDSDKWVHIRFATKDE
ncbi:hypothetical protein HOO65_050014 [Ceratocystis lukuohia]|uniref:Uncharacterized protein n=1 Tax=Ceratocystis lukuohia TaxID=2019550 RepID=A0ABR4MF26_9PEZI